MTDKLEELADEFDVDLDTSEPGELAEVDVDGVEMEAREATVIKPFRPGNGSVKDETHNYVLENGNQFSLTVKQRPECPSCKHVLAEPDEPNQLAGECSVCGKQTCHRNQSKCEGCGTIFCPDHAKGHGLKDSAYCGDCLGDVVQDIGFDRGMEKRKQSHSEELDQLEKELKQEKQAKKLELQEAKQQRSQIRKDWKIVIQLLDTLKNGDEDDDGDEQEDEIFGGDAFQGNSDAFSGGMDLSGDSDDYGWFDDIEQEIDGRIAEAKE